MEETLSPEKGVAEYDFGPALRIEQYKCMERAVCWLTVRWDSDALGRAAEAEDGAWPFPRGISPSDIDGFIEYNGECLFIETKPRNGGREMRGGQKRALTALSSKGVTVLVQECDPPAQDAVVRTCVVRGGQWFAWKDSTRLERDRLVQRWFAWVDREARAA